MLQIIRRFYNAFCYSWNGIKFAWKSQWAFRIELFILIVATPIAILLSKSIVEFLLMICAIILLPILELLNSAVETTVNRISLDYHELSGLAKDLASAALFVAGLNVVFIWAVILGMRLLGY